MQQLLVRLGRIDDAFHFRLMINAGYVSVSYATSLLFPMRFPRLHQ